MTTDSQTSEHPLFDVVQAFLDERGFVGERPDDDTVVRLDGYGDHGEWMLWLSTDEPKERCVIYSVAPWLVDEEHRPAVMELVTRINNTLAVGSYDFDLDTGQLAFRTSVDVEDDRLSPALLKQLVAANVEAFGTYFPAVKAVALEGEAPVAALDAIEL